MGLKLTLRKPFAKMYFSLMDIYSALMNLIMKSVRTV